jgi:hypothetical protein
MISVPWDVTARCLTDISNVPEEATASFKACSSSPLYDSHFTLIFVPLLLVVFSLILLLPVVESIHIWEGRRMVVWTPVSIQG